MEHDPYDGFILRGEAEVTDGDEGEIAVAKMTFYQVDYEGLQAGGGRDDFQVFDAISHQLMEIYSIFYDKGNLVTKLQDVGNNMLHLDHLVVEKEFRRRGIGKVLIDRVLRACRGWNVVVIKPFPLQIDNDHPEKYDDLPQKGALKKLRKYYESMGFCRYGKTEYYYLMIDQYLLDNPVPLSIEGEF
jgi:GNAT superfamily N-acetyltransferase